MTNDTDPKFTAYKEKTRNLGKALFIIGIVTLAVIGGVLFLIYGVKA